MCPPYWKLSKNKSFPTRRSSSWGKWSATDRPYWISKGNTNFDSRKRNCKKPYKRKFSTMIKTDIIIIGAGPTGLFTVFEAGLLKLKCHLIDALPQPGGQCSEIYPKKPIYDIPAYPEILAGDLVDRLLEQIRPFEPGYTLGERAETLERQEDGSFIVTTLEGTRHHAPIVVI